MEPPARLEDPGVDPGRTSRRTFLKSLGGAAGVVAVGGLGPGGALAAPVRKADDLANEHAGDPALLIDLSRCTGCGACVTACKLTNGLAWRQDQPSLGPEAELASANWTAVRTERPAQGEGPTRYVKLQCLHCMEPACVSVCFVRALRKSPQGPVVYDPSRCVGCRYCVMACPFGVPTFEWDRAFPTISKCNLCFQRTSRGEPTACAQACPAGAITFGTRQQMLERAKGVIAAAADRYDPHIFGEREAGGTSVMYISDVPFRDLAFRTGVPGEPLPDYTWEVSRLIPPVAVGLGAALSALLVARRRQLAREATVRRGPGEGADQ